MLPTPQYIRFLRKKTGLTQKELAMRAGVSQSLIARIECGTVDPRLSTLRKIVGALEEALRRKVGAKDFMNSPVITVGANEPIGKVARLMWKHGISQIPIVEDGSVIGTVLEDDIVEALMTMDDVASKPVREIMGKALPAMEPHEDINNVIRVLMIGSPAVLVVEGGKLLGIITKSDIIAKKLAVGTKVQEGAYQP